MSSILKHIFPTIKKSPWLCFKNKIVVKQWKIFRWVLQITLVTIQKTTKLPTVDWGLSAASPSHALLGDIHSSSITSNPDGGLGGGGVFGNCDVVDPGNWAAGTVCTAVETLFGGNEILCWWEYPPWIAQL